MSSRRAIAAGSGSTFDRRRNTSNPGGVEPGARDECRRALAAYRREHPEVYAYVEAGSPPILSDEDHVRWFGRPYERTTRRRRS